MAKVVLINTLVAMIKHLGKKRHDGRGCGGFSSHAATRDLEIYESSLDWLDVIAV
jgi:hypothetical protein